MTNEIINDGVDVSKCVHLDEWKHCNICKELIKTIPDRHQCLTEQDLRCKYYSNCYYKQLKRTQNALQEIKVVAETPSPYIDNFEIKTATEVEYDYAAICNELELRLHKVLEKIIKAEEE